jgi:adenylate cyclase
VVVTVALSAIVLWINYQRGSAAALTAADRLLEQESERIVARMELLVEPVFSVVDAAALAASARFDVPARGDHALAPVMFAVLERYPQITALYLGKGNGDFFRVMSLNAVRSNARSFLKAPADTAFAVQAITRERGGRVERWRFIDAQRRELSTAEDSDEDFDPRQRPWYIGAQAADRTFVTDNYVFASVPQIGMTVARSVGDANGTVVGADLTLTSVSRYLARVRDRVLSDGSAAEVAVFNAQEQLLAHSDNAAYESLLNSAETPRIPRVGEVGRRVMPRLMAVSRQLGPGALRVTGEDGAQWLCRVAKVPPAFGKDAYVALAVPVGEVLGPLARSSRQTLLVSLAIVLAFLPVVYLAAGAISAPLRRLTGEIAGLQNFDVKSTPAERSGIAEIQDLANALATAKSMLGAFAKYVPKNLVRQIVASGDEPRLGGERRPLTVFFSDVKDFTTISEQVAPERLMEFTSQYLEGLVHLILEHHGTVDKFVGDQVMAYWNAPTPNPDHAADGCRAILACRDWSNAQNERWAREGTPVLYTRFALHLGDAIVGNVGSSDRMDYTVVGATINLGSRIEGLNKVYGTQILITHPIAQAIGAQFVHRPVDRVLPKGAVHPLDVHELIGALADVDAHKLARCKAWSTVYASYLSRDWEACARELAAFVAHFGEDMLTRIYADRIRAFKAHPPPTDWDGVIRYATK